MSIKYFSTHLIPNLSADSLYKSKRRHTLVGIHQQRTLSYSIIDINAQAVAVAALRAKNNKYERTLPTRYPDNHRMQCLRPHPSIRSADARKNIYH